MGAITLIFVSWQRVFEDMVPPKSSCHRTEAMGPLLHVGTFATLLLALSSLVRPSNSYYKQESYFLLQQLRMLIRARSKSLPVEYFLIVSLFLHTTTNICSLSGVQHADIVRSQSYIIQVRPKFRFLGKANSVRITLLAVVGNTYISLRLYAT